MLLNFTIGNWMSYRDETSLSMVSSRERQHLGTCAKIPGFRSKKAVPVAAIYGGNASGKTNMFRALASLKHMVLVDPGVNGAVSVEPFRLESNNSKSTLFDVTFLAGERVYRFVVEATSSRIAYESLETINEHGAQDIYERIDDGENASFSFDAEFFTDLEHARYAAKSTRSNRLFLGSAVSQNIHELTAPYNWFARTLELVGVESQARSFATCATSKEGFLEYASNILSLLDTGISRLTSEQVGLDVLPPDSELHNNIANLGPDETITMVSERLSGDYGFDMLTIRNDQGTPLVERLRTVHIGPDGEEHTFLPSMESSGTQRLMGLLPMLFDLTDVDGSVGEKVYVVDELDRCLHTMLTRKVLEDFLGTCNAETRKQILFTTHDLLLMDQSIMRRDEMYIAERGTDGCSVLVGLSEYKDVRNDKDLIRSYLEGRFGGIPMLSGAGARG